jgi:DNA-directed RNA polymerase subunit K/omega
MSVLASLDISVSPFIESRRLDTMASKSGNLYRSVVIVGKRANQISSALREELHTKLQEFASTTDNLEEVFENREQIEISRYYESMPNPTLIATSEFFQDKIYWRDPGLESTEN